MSQKSIIPLSSLSLHHIIKNSTQTYFLSHPQTPTHYFSSFFIRLPIPAWKQTYLIYFPSVATKNQKYLKERKMSEQKSGNVLWQAFTQQTLLTSSEEQSKTGPWAVPSEPTFREVCVTCHCVTACSLARKLWSNTLIKTLPREKGILSFCLGFRI